MTGLDGLRVNIRFLWHAIVGDEVFFETELDGPKAKSIRQIHSKKLDELEE